MLTDRFGIGDCFGHAVAEIIRMRARETKPANSGNSANCAKQIGKVVSSVCIGVHSLPKQHDLGHPLCDDLARFANYFVKLSAALRTACRRHDAIRAAIITAALNGDPGLYLVETSRLEVLVVLLEVEIRRSRLDAAPRVLDQQRKRAISIRSDHETHMTRTLEKLRTESLRHAAGDSEDRVLLHPALHFAEAADHPLLGVLANRACVDEDDVGSFRGVHLVVAGRREFSEYQLGITHVHLAAVSLYVNRGPRVSHGRFHQGMR